jgi:hypothetical protein
MLDSLTRIGFTYNWNYGIILIIFIKYYNCPTQYKEYLNDLLRVLNMDLKAYSLFMKV